MPSGTSPSGFFIFLKDSQTWQALCIAPTARPCSHNAAHVGPAHSGTSTRSAAVRTHCCFTPMLSACATVLPITPQNFSPWNKTLTCMMQSSCQSTRPGKQKRSSPAAIQPVGTSCLSFPIITEGKRSLWRGPRGSGNRLLS